MFSQGFRLPSLLTLLILAACSDDPATSPSADPDLRLRVLASGTAGNPRNPLSFQGVAWNAGGGSVSYLADCCSDPVTVGIMNERGEWLRTGMEPVCRCAVATHPFPPEPVTGRLRFDGRILGSTGWQWAPTGRYTALAVLHYRVEPEERIVQRVEAIPFDWFGD